MWMAVHGWAGGAHSMAPQPFMYCLGGWVRHAAPMFGVEQDLSKLRYSAREPELLSDFWALVAR